MKNKKIICILVLFFFILYTKVIATSEFNQIGIEENIISNETTNQSVENLENSNSVNNTISNPIENTQPISDPVISTPSPEPETPNNTKPIDNTNTKPVTHDNPVHETIPTSTTTIIPPPNTINTNNSSISSENTIKKSINTYLNSLTIQNFELSPIFNKYRLIYYITVPDNINSLNIDYTLQNTNSIVAITR